MFSMGALIMAFSLWINKNAIKYIYNVSKPRFESDLSLSLYAYLWRDLGFVYTVGFVFNTITTRYNVY